MNPSFFGLLWTIRAWLSAVVVATALPLVLATARNFEYEYWLLATALFGLGSIAIGCLGTAGKANSRAHPVLPRLALSLAPRLTLSLALPLLALALAALWRQLLACPCAVGEFWLWWLWQFAPSALGFFALAGLLSAWRQQGSGPWLSAGAGLAIALAPLVLLWLFPQKRLLSLLIGYIHGPIYDRLIPFTEVQQGLRLGQGLIAIALIACLGLSRQRLTAAFALGLALSTAITAVAPSTGHGHSSLRRELSGAIDRDGLTLWYAPGTISQTRLTELADEAAFHVADLKAKLALQPDHVAIYVYPDRQTKKAWFGGLTTDITDVVSPSIHITADRFPHGTLRHELVHALAARDGFFGLGFHPNMAITEGLAVYHAPRQSRYDLDTEAATITRKFWQGDVAGLFGPAFWAYSGARAYRVAGSVLGYLTRRYGSAAVLRLYGGASFAAAFGKDRDQVVADWLAMLAERYDPALDDVLSRRYAYGGVLADTCPHSKASARQARSAAPDAKHWWQLRAGDWRPPAASPGHPGLRLIPAAKLSPARLAKLDQQLSTLLNESDPLPAGLRLRLLLRLASVQALLGAPSAEAAGQSKALAAAKAMPGIKPPGLARLIAILELLVAQQTEGSTANIHRFLLSGDAAQLTGSEGAEDFATAYLRLRNTTVAHCPKVVLPPGQPYVLIRAWYQQQLACLYRNKGPGPAALAALKAWQHEAPKGSEDARALAIEAALVAAVAGGSR